MAKGNRPGEWSKTAKQLTQASKRLSSASGQVTRAERRFRSASGALRMLEKTASAATQEKYYNEYEKAKDRLERAIANRDAARDEVARLRSKINRGNGSQRGVDIPF